MNTELAEIMNSIEVLKGKSPYIKTYEKNTIKILKGQGSIIGEKDKLHLDFLKESNGLSLLDYCFWGFKNSHLYPTNIYDEMNFFWSKENMATFKFWCFAGNSAGERFGYINKKNSYGNHFIAYYSQLNPNYLQLIASNFNIFIVKFISDIDKQVNSDNSSLDIENYFFMDSEKLTDNDKELSEFIALNHGQSIVSFSQLS
ncbi:hypothetical protein SAMN05660772_02772 [Pasteurella testudinis DSM 23072]|uniref:SMI1 / KNR4 family (SUKH-1) n=1 Tax=Pasteurella testudinis DSM 23072 TaxID=1122938 RepID=A0A1W1V3R5_9PAST|nr:hypothetical protein [Pasteurella testudinis]SMB87930.1 hypothetical protein SAMN05660772_02772 [Pasteurella testudinis DSM 23072]SUB52184.1 Uncharacterised protein [Pasteurella testudinis]